MIPRPAADVTRMLAGLARRADAALADSAARNAAASVAARRAVRLEELRTLRDLRALEACGPVPTSRAGRGRIARG